MSERPICPVCGGDKAYFGAHRGCRCAGTACFNDERGIHKRTAGGLCEQCGDYRPDWRWEKPSFQHSYDDGQLDGAADTCARIVAWLRAGCGTGDAHAVRSPAVVADLIERGEHLRPLADETQET